MTRLLCSLLRTLEEKGIPFNPTGELGDWWEKHQEDDKRRELAEAAAAEKKDRLEKALEELVNCICECMEAIIRDAVVLADDACQEVVGVGPGAIPRDPGVFTRVEHPGRNC